MNKIVWLASFPKSGNTWTRVFLMNLFMNPSQPLSINEIHEMSPQDSGYDWYKLIDNRPRDRWTLAEVARLRHKVHAEIARHAPDLIFVKTHSPLSSWEGVPTFNMKVTAGAVYIVRNPLDVVASYANHSGLDIDPMIAIMNKANYLAPGSESLVPHPIGSWSQNVETWTAKPHPGIHVMRYEDMVTRPEKTFGGLVQFLQLPKDRKRLLKALKFSSFEQLSSQESKEGFKEGTKKAERFFRGGKTGGWRNELTTAQAQAIVNANRTQMERFGYVPDGL
jgi:hypothetical protein